MAERATPTTNPVGPRRPRTRREAEYWAECESLATLYRGLHPEWPSDEVSYGVSTVCQWLWDRCWGFCTHADLHGAELFWEYLVDHPYRSTYDARVIASAVAGFLGYLGLTGAVSQGTADRLQRQANAEAEAWLRLGAGEMGATEMLQRIRRCRDAA